MEPDEQVGLWLHDPAAKLLLGLTEHGRPVSRWVVVGKVVDPNWSPIGALVDVAYVEELRPSPDHTDARISWTVHPGQCVIRWDYIITVQRMADAPAPIDPRPAPGLYL